MNTSACPERSAGVDDGAFRLRPLRGLRSTRTETVRRGVEGRGGNASRASSKRSPFQGFLTDRCSSPPPGRAGSPPDRPGAVAAPGHDPRPLIEPEVVARGHVEDPVRAPEIPHLLERSPEGLPELARAGARPPERYRDRCLEEEPGVPGMRRE